MESIYNYALVDLVRSNDGKVIHSNLPLVDGNKYLETSPILMEMICGNEFSKHSTKDVGIVVGPFEAVFIKRKGQC